MLPTIRCKALEFCRSPLSQGRKRTPRRWAHNPHLRGVLRNPRRRQMRSNLLFPILVLAVIAGLAVVMPRVAPAGEVPSISNYKVLAPISHGNLTIFPVVAATAHDTQGFLTLDEGLRSGDVVVSESGNVAPLV